MVRQFGATKDCPPAALVQERLLQRNYDLKLVKACVDRTDGEVMFGIRIPIEDGELTKQQVLRCLRAIGMAMHRHGGKLRRLIYTAEREDDDEDDPLETLLAGMREITGSGDGEDGGDVDADEDP